MKPSFVYINGYPGVGKLTIAQELCILLPNAKVFDNHRLIDVAACIFERSMPGYQLLRSNLRRTVLTSIAGSPSVADVTFIFTDQQSSSRIGSSAAKQFRDAAQEKGCPFVSIILLCDEQPNIKRLTSVSRGDRLNAKLTDYNVLKQIREAEDIYHFGHELEVELDVSAIQPEEAARKIRDYLVRHIPE